MHVRLTIYFSRFSNVLFASLLYCVVFRSTRAASVLRRSATSRAPSGSQLSKFLVMPHRGYDTHPPCTRVLSVHPHSVDMHSTARSTHPRTPALQETTTRTTMTITDSLTLTTSLTHSLKPGEMAAPRTDFDDKDDGASVDEFPDGHGGKTPYVVTMMRCSLPNSSNEFKSLVLIFSVFSSCL